MEMKKRFKMYKAGRRWVTAAILFGGTAFFMGANAMTVQADETAETQTQQTEAVADTQAAETQPACVQNQDTKQDDAGQTDVKQPAADQSSAAQTDTVQNTQTDSRTNESQDNRQNAVRQPATQEKTQQEKAAEPVQQESKTGFQKEQNRTYYYDNDGNMVHGQRNIDGGWYLFDERTGEMKTGFQWIAAQNKKVYYDGNGRMQYGQQHIDRWWYLFDNSTGAMKTGFQYIASQRKVVYYNGNGQMQYGRQRIGGRTYDMNRSTGAVAHGSGQQNIGGHWYLFDGNGSARTGFQWIASQRKTVYYNGAGQMQYGQQHIGSNWYLFAWGTGAMQKGMQNLRGYGENKTVLYDGNGRMQYGQRNVKGHWYLFQHGTGAMATGFQNLKSYGQDKTVYYAGNGQMQYGQQRIGGSWYLFNGRTGAMARGFQWIANQKKTVYYDDNGRMQYGFRDINGKRYYFDTALGAMKTGQQRVGGNWYLFNSRGEMQKGFQWIANQKKTVYYDDNGRMQYGFRDINGKRYYFDTALGAMKTGQQRVGGNWYLFNSRGEMQKGFQWIANQKKTVYYDDNGRMQYGFRDINGRRYYFNTANGAMTTGEKKIGSDWYLFNQNGEMQKGLQGDRYYDESTGRRQTGMREINGVKYHFDEDSGRMTKSQVGYDRATGSLYLFDNYGHVEYSVHGYSIDSRTGALAYRGIVELNGSHYFFDNNGRVRVGFVNVNGRTQFFDQKTARRVSGQLHVNNNWYLFDANGNMKTGFQWISNQKKTCYYNGSGQMQYGQQHLSGYWYLFDKNSGAMLTGLQNLAPYGQNKTCLYNSQGRMVYGQQNYKGHWYLFDKFSGAMQHGFQNLRSYGQNKVVYYAGNGQMQYRWQVIGHDQYYFDGASGVRYTGRRWVDGAWRNFDGNGRLMCFTQRVLDWFFSRIGRLTYSMYGSRTGADGTADCSGSMTAALRAAGASKPDRIHNTETIHPYLTANGYYLARQGRDNYVPQYGDIIIWGQRGHSAGDGGHIMIMSSAGSDAKCISTCGYYWDRNPDSIYGARGKAVQEFNYAWYHKNHNNAYYYVYRPVNLRRG